MRKIGSKLNYANVVATLALVIAVGGASAFAATHLAQNSVGPRQLRKNAVTSAKIKNGAVTGAKIKLSTLGTVPSAERAASAESAGRAATAGVAERATSAAVAGALAPPEAVHLVGAPGEPPFENGFEKAPPGLSPPGFYRDRECVVHLLGTIRGESQHVAFRLPPADAPAQEAFGAIAVAGAEAGNLTVTPSGTVEPVSEPGISTFGLDGFSFRAANC